MLTAVDVPVSVQTLHDSVHLWLTHKFPEDTRVGNAWYIDVLSVYRKFLAVVPDRPVANITIDEAIDITQFFLDYRRTQGISAIRLDNDRRYLSYLWVWLAKRRIVPFRGNPTERKWLDLPKPEHKCKACLSDLDIEKLLNATRERDIYPHVVLCLACGMRPIESCRVEWEHIDFAEARIRVWGKSRERHIPVSKWALDELKLWRTKFMWLTLAKRVINRKLTQIRKESGLPAAVTFQAMRRTFAWKAFQADIPGAKVAMLMGNSLKVIERHYVQFDQMSAHQSVNLIKFPVLQEQRM